MEQHNLKMNINENKNFWHYKKENKNLSLMNLNKEKNKWI